jgi:hypothetical protein
MSGSDDRVGSKLNARRVEQRLSHLREFVRNDTEGVASTQQDERVLCSLPTFYSLGAHSPSYVAYEARKAGLGAVGTIDELSIAAGDELYEACKILGLGSTFGFRLQVHFDHSPLKELLPSEPDGSTLAQIELYGVPFTARDHVQQFLRPIQDARNARQRKQLGRLNKALSHARLGSIDFDSEVLSLSASGGTVTDSHLMLALAKRVLKRNRSDDELGRFLRDSLKLAMDSEQFQRVTAAAGQRRAYVLAELLRERFLDEIRLAPNRSECVSAADAVSFALEVGAIPCFQLLFLPEEEVGLRRLLEGLSGAGFAAISLDPSFVADGQMERLHALSREQELLELPAAPPASHEIELSAAELTRGSRAGSGEAAFGEASWAIVAHQQLESCNPRLGLLAAGNPFYDRALPDRAGKYAELGRQIDPAEPESACEQLQNALS